LLHYEETQRCGWKTLANKFQAKLPVNFQSMIYKTKMFNQCVEDSAEKLFKLLCLHLNDPAYKSKNPKNSDKKKDFKKKFEKFEKSDDKQKKQEKSDKTHLKCDSCGKTGHIKEDCFSKCSICSKAGHNLKNCSQIKKTWKNFTSTQQVKAIKALETLKDMKAKNLKFEIVKKQPEVLSVEEKTRIEIQKAKEALKSIFNVKEPSESTFSVQEMNMDGEETKTA
jgi:hypothetical protein